MISFMNDVLAAALYIAACLALCLIAIPVFAERKRRPRR